MKKIFTLLTLTLAVLNVMAADIKGKVYEKSIDTPSIGAVVVILEDPANAIATDINGGFTLKNVSLPATLRVTYFGCKPQTIELKDDAELSIILEPDAVAIEGVTITRRRRQNNEVAMINALKNTQSVSVGVSGSQISKSSDSDAGEVVKRIPGISIIDGRFIIVRGLAQRYNNVWLNGGSVPSTEADGRAFSFDMIPSSSIDNIVISKSYSADLPGDYSGGFIKISTKNAPTKDQFQFSLGTGFNSSTHFQNVKLGNSAPTEWLGFDASVRPLGSDFPSNLAAVSDKSTLNNIYKNGFNNDWSVNTFAPLPDIKASLQWDKILSDNVSMILAANYQNSYKAIRDMINNRYGVYNNTADLSSLEKEYTDNQFTNEVKAGVMNNWMFKLDNYNRIEFRNLLNLVSQNKLVERTGWTTVSGEYYEDQTELYYSSRLSYTGQLAGSHTFGENSSNNIDWNATYSYANRDEPDRRIVSNIGLGQRGDSDLDIYNDKIKRYYQSLSDNILSGALNYKKTFYNDNSWTPTLKAGLYSEYRGRGYDPREFTYYYRNLPSSDRSEYIRLPFEEMMNPIWMGTDKVIINETGMNSNAYDGTYFVGAGYASATLPVGSFIFDLGARLEYWDMGVTYDRSMDPNKKMMTTNKYDELSILPALNMSYNISKEHIIRASYGRNVNRPEFREVSPSIYYDFDLFAEVQGNPDLKMATIDNFDLRYEFYPTSGEIVSLGLFYKNFQNPIEWNFTNMGGTYRYSYENAKSAYTAGVEIDLRKRLDFIGVPEVSLVMNTALTISEVQFNNDGLVQQKSRPLQGQSPYIINVGAYYDSNDELGLSASVLYNLLGERIVGIGKTLSTDPNSNYELPDSYELPRNLLDVTIAKQLGKRVNLKLGVKNILNSPVVYKQYPTATVNGASVGREQLTREYYPGVSASLSISVKF